jgi:hypothetical protein
LQAPAPGLRGAGHGRHVGARGALRRRRPPAPLPHLHEDLPLAAPRPPGSPAVAPKELSGLCLTQRALRAQQISFWAGQQGGPRCSREQSWTGCASMYPEKLLHVTSCTSMNCSCSVVIPSYTGIYRTVQEISYTIMYHHKPPYTVLDLFNPGLSYEGTG